MCGACRVAVVRVLPSVGRCHLINIKVSLSSLPFIFRCLCPLLVFSVPSPTPLLYTSFCLVLSCLVTPFLSVPFLLVHAGMYRSSSLFSPPAALSCPPVLNNIHVKHPQAFYLKTYSGTQVEHPCNVCIKPPDDVCDACNFDLYDAQTQMLPTDSSDGDGDGAVSDGRRRRRRRRLTSSDRSGNDFDDAGGESSSSSFSSLHGLSEDCGACLVSEPKRGRATLFVWL